MKTLTRIAHNYSKLIAVGIVLSLTALTFVVLY